MPLLHVTNKRFLACVLYGKGDVGIFNSFFFSEEAHVFVVN